MENHSTLNAPKLWTKKLLYIGGTINLIALLFGFTWPYLDLDVETTIWIGLTFTIGFGINMSGLIAGLIEYSKNKRSARFGLIGNAIFVALFIALVVLSFNQ